MTKLYKKNEVGFAILWIVLYVVLTSLAEAVSEELGIHKLIPLLVHLVMTAVLWIWVKKNGLLEKYGFCKPRYPASRFLYYLPLLLLATSGVWAGFALNYSVPESIFHFVSMLCVGFLEELIFRGLLFKGMAKKNVRSAIIVSAVTFGIGHIVNLLNGQPLGETLLQIVFAITVGFVLVLLFHRGGSLIPCIVFHSLNNSLNTFAASSQTDYDLIVNVAIIVVLGFGYLFYLLKALPEPERRRE